MKTYALTSVPDAAFNAARAAAWAYLQNGPLDDLLSEAAHAPLRSLALPLQACWSVGLHAQVTLKGALTPTHITRARMIAAQPGCVWAGALLGPLRAATFTGTVTLSPVGMRTQIAGSGTSPEVHSLVDAVMQTCSAHLHTTHAQLRDGGASLTQAAERFGWQFDRHGALVQVAPPLTLFADALTQNAPTISTQRPKSLFEEM
ncbi:hypothetical protein [Deinococcus soli (ex Cha et al. 2016)]|uniref:Uncharacterized protein n=2 Tax=Deinococcus soli (ex Cha et al. 2016) TaxID=1309411 RepID=A0AAE3XCK6_9DEIO|nr:hypothetical protein [Deinococcus soli (ex Cha et al. 2016)]MDR6218444.1 hypothetical protein [Deinococcus soli (ex Cha et al. 2016)]MDR6329184.1 hypothetical protein [Deinococcus soli (ex Cha et al. 2016)]MDR6751457.1 hypothetical protein [Deinococcus soli (ex Cha et al. 2016)]